MQPDISPSIPPLLQPPPRRRAPTLYAIIALKLVGGVVFLLAAFAIYSVSEMNLQEEFHRILLEANMGSASGLFGDSEKLLREITPSMIRLFAIGFFLYGLLSLVQGVGLCFRAAWAGWLVIGESAVFVPVELWDLARHFSSVMVVTLALNIAILWYLYANRRRLFDTR